MASTTFHIPDHLLREIDRAARSRGVSRNKFVLQACGEALAREAGAWPQDFFEPSLDPDDENVLAQATRELEREVRARRTNRGAVAL
jgi:hypothetical protein